MKTIEVSSASRPLAEYAGELEDEIIVVTSNETPIAALVSLKGVDRESLALSTSPEFMEIIDQARRQFKSGKKLTLDQMKQAVSKMT